MGEIRPFLYNLPQVGAAMLGCDPVWIVEGEKDADTLTGLGYAATTNPFGAGKFTDAMISSLDNATQIKIIIDNDLPGISHGKDIYRRLRVRQPDRQIEIYRSTIGKDITEHLASGGTF